MAIGTGLFGAPTNPYAAASAGPMSAQQKKAVQGPRTKRSFFPKKDSDNKNTDPIKTPEPEKTYSNVAKPLSAESIMALAQKRLNADQQFQFAKERETSGTSRFKASFEAGKSMLNKERKSATQKLARQLAGRGLARSPMFAGRGQVEIGQKFDDQIGQMQLTLANEIEALKMATEEARLERERILGDIKLEEAVLRSAPDDYVTQGV